MPLPTFESLNLQAITPLLVLFGWACGLILIDVFLIKNKRVTAWLAALGILVTLALVILHITSAQVASESAFLGMLVVDGFALFLQVVFLLAAFIGVLFSLDYLTRTKIERGEYYTLLLFTTGGMMTMAMAADLIMIFLSLELLSIPLYVLAGFARPRLESEESAMKYFLLGAFASGFLVYGIAMTYGAVQGTALSDVLAALQPGGEPNPLLLVGLGLILVGLGFKVAAVPFHMWTPDVYQGAPTPVTGFMSVGAKAGGFAALLRVLVLAYPALAGQWGIAIEVIAGLTMVLGNIVAVSQTHIKRMLAYSSIAHAGYILVAVAATQNAGVANEATSAALFYLMAYAFTNLGAFAVVIAVERDDGSGGLIDDFAGLGKARPLLAAIMTLFMLSLIGIPPSAGMVGKWFIFRAAVHADLVALAIVGVITSVISAFYYARVVLVMWMKEGEAAVSLRPALVAALTLTALGTLALGIYPTPLFDLAQRSLLMLVAG
jgi:NADH-quinone oxidoreductase subunit N